MLFLTCKRENRLFKNTLLRGTGRLKETFQQRNKTLRRYTRVGVYGTYGRAAEYHRTLYILRCSVGLCVDDGWHTHLYVIYYTIPTITTVFSVRFLTTLSYRNTRWRVNPCEVIVINGRRTVENVVQNIFLNLCSYNGKHVVLV